MENNTILMLFVFVPILSFILLALNLLLSKHNPDESKISEFGCGFISVSGQTRSNFDIQFVVVAVLFLVFDLEIMLLLPYILVLDQVSLFGFSVFVLFLIILTVGFVLEIGSGAISLSHINLNINENNE